MYIHKFIFLLRSTKSIKILDVILKQSTPIKTVTTTTPASQPQTNSDKPQTQTSSVTNDDSLSSLNGSHLLTTPIKQSSVKGTPASSPMSLDVSSVANEYSYVIQFLDGSKKQITTLYHNLRYVHVYTCMYTLYMDRGTVHCTYMYFSSLAYMYKM